MTFFHCDNYLDCACKNNLNLAYFLVTKAWRVQVGTSEAF